MTGVEDKGVPPRRGVLGRSGGLAAGLIGLLIGASAVALWAKTGNTPAPTERAATEKIVHDYLLANPELIPAAMQRLQDRETAKAIGARRAAYETPFGSAWAGAEDGDVVLVEFFDYACGYCRKSNADVDRLLREDKGLKAVWREFPVLGEDSVLAAEASLAAAQQGKFAAYFTRQFALGRPNARTVAEAQRAAGVTPMPASQAARSEIERNYGLTSAIQASGTPTFVVGDRVLHGAVGYDALKQAIAVARSND